MTVSELIPSFIKELVGCNFGHVWEKEPRSKENIKLTGPDILFFTYGTQAGTQHCSQCSATRQVTRSGFVGLGGSAGEWKPK